QRSRSPSRCKAPDRPGPEGLAHLRDDGSEEGAGLGTVASRRASATAAPPGPYGDRDHEDSPPGDDPVPRHGSPGDPGQSPGKGHGRVQVPGDEAAGDDEDVARDVQREAHNAAALSSLRSSRASGRHAAFPARTRAASYRSAVLLDTHTISPARLMHIPSDRCRAYSAIRRFVKVAPASARTGRA